MMRRRYQDCDKRIPQKTIQPTERRYKQQSTDHIKIPLEEDGSCYSIDSDLQERWMTLQEGTHLMAGALLFTFLISFSFFWYLTYLYCHLRYPIFLSFKKFIIICSWYSLIMNQSILLFPKNILCFVICSTFIYLWTSRRTRSNRCNHLLSHLLGIASGYHQAPKSMRYETIRSVCISSECLSVHA